MSPSRGSLAPGGSAFGGSALGCPTFSRSAFGCGSSPGGCDGNGDGTDGDCVRCSVNVQQAIQRTLAVHPQHLTPDTGVVGILGSITGTGCPSGGGVYQCVSTVSQHPASLVVGSFEIITNCGLYIQSQYTGGHRANQAADSSAAGKLVVCGAMALIDGNFLRGTT